MDVETKTFTLIPPAPGNCPICAYKHEPDQPHNRHSLYYQMAFHQQHGRWPTWADAMAHCSEEVKQAWMNAAPCSDEVKRAWMGALEDGMRKEEEV